MEWINGRVFLSLVPPIGSIHHFKPIQLLGKCSCGIFFLKVEILFRPDVMDRAALRPGRFGKLIHVPMPTANERELILRALARKKPIDADVDMIALAQMACQNLSGADLAALVCLVFLFHIALLS